MEQGNRVLHIASGVSDYGRRFARKNSKVKNTTRASLVAQQSPANGGDVCSTPGLGKFPREGNGNPLQYSCLGNPTDRGAWWDAVHGAVKEPDQ